MRVGILGGSFNPPHKGHLALARAALATGAVERVCLIPAAVPPHKLVPREAGPVTRLAMAHLLAGEDGRLDADALELRRSGPSYTIDTIRELIQAHPGREYRLIIGSDLAMTFATWRAYQEILRLAPPLVAERPDAPFTGTGDFSGMKPEEEAILVRGRFPMEPAEVSSTLVRRLLAEGVENAGLRHLLTPTVLAFIRENRLYRAMTST